MAKPVEFYGEQFAVPERFNMRSMTRFASLAKRGFDSDDIEGMAAIDSLIDQCIRPEDIGRFDRLCDKHRPGFEELIGYVSKVLEAVTDRPTTQPSDSSAGLRPIGPKSTDDSSSRVVERLEKAGRPDLALMVTQAQEARSA